jgi:hypothetical protein
MVSIHSQQLAQQLFTKLSYSALLVTLICTTVFLTRAVSQSWSSKISLYEKLVPENFFYHLFTTERNKKVEAAILASLLGQDSQARFKCSTTKMEDIQRNTEILYRQMEQALARIKENVQKNRELAERLTGSPIAIRTIKDLDATIAAFTPVRPIAEYQVSEYATRNRRWRCTPYQHPVSIQDLLLHDIQTRQEKNKLLGEKVEKIMLQNQVLAQQTSSIYDTPSEKLKKIPIMNILAKAVTKYMFLKNMNNPRQGNEI